MLIPTGTWSCCACVLLVQEELDLLCEGRFSRKDICSVEMHLLRIVNWELNPPNTFTFARDFVHALALKDADEIVQPVTELLKFVTEGKLCLHTKDDMMNVKVPFTGLHTHC